MVCAGNRGADERRTGLRQTRDRVVTSDSQNPRPIGLEKGLLVLVARDEKVLDAGHKVVALVQKARVVDTINHATV